MKRGDSVGIYLHPSVLNFETSLNSEIYIDKTNLIAFTNRQLNTQQKYVCISRPRRFGKTMAANMLAAYYDREADTDQWFRNLAIATSKDYTKHLNGYDVIKIDMQSFLNKSKNIESLLTRLTSYLVREVKKEYPSIVFFEEEDLPEVLNQVLSETGGQFIIIIDEWDCVMRRIVAWEEQKRYLDFLRDLFKDQPYVALAYMTGILPIKKYGEHSALNMFQEYSMIDSAEISDCFGFTEQEVHMLCEKYNRDFGVMQEWYDGYHMISEAFGQKKEFSIYSPNSVIEAIRRGKYTGYWSQTETYEALKKYIQMNQDGLKDAIVNMLSGNAIPVNTRHFQNDMNTFASRDDILTLLIHIGYLAYHQNDMTVTIPNKEVEQEFIASIEMIPSYDTVNLAIRESKDLLQALWDMDGKAVAKGVEKAHQEISVLKYNDENSLSCVIQLAFYYAREYYTMVRELPSGKGYADICMIPRKNSVDKPAIILELKWNQNADTAIAQMKRNHYPEGLEEYKDNMILCGINYDKKGKRHECMIEKYER